MEYEHYYVANKEGKSNCVIRSFCKLYNEEYDNVFNDLCNIAKEINYDSFNEVEVFETYMKRKNTFDISYDKDIKIKDLKLNDGKYIVFCYDKKDFYHMICIIDNVIYDKSEECFDLYTINIYRLNDID